MTLSDLIFAALAILRSFGCETAVLLAEPDVRAAFLTFGAKTAFPLADALADDFVDVETRLDFERPALVFEGAAARLETLAPLAAPAPLAAAFFAGRSGLVILAEILASLLLADELDFDRRLITFDGRLDDFFVAFFPVDMTGLLLKLSASGVI